MLLKQYNTVGNELSRKLFNPKIELDNEFNMKNMLQQYQMLIDSASRSLTEKLMIPIILSLIL